MAGKYRIEPHNHSRELVEQINKQFDAIEASIKVASTPATPAAPVSVPGSRVNVTSGIAGPAINQVVSVDPASIQGNGTNIPISGVPTTATVMAGAATAMPPPGGPGNMYFATDIKQLFISDESGNWVAIA